MAVLSLVGSQAGAQDAVSRMKFSARTAFSSMPDVRVVDQITGVCGADDAVSARVVYCTTTNEILVSKDQVLVPELPADCNSRVQLYARYDG